MNDDFKQIFTVTAECISEHNKPLPLSIEKITQDILKKVDTEPEQAGGLVAAYNEILSRLPAQLWQKGTTDKGNRTVYGARFGLYSYYLDSDTDGTKRGKIPRYINGKTFDSYRLTGKDIGKYAQSFDVAVMALLKHQAQVGYDKISFGVNAGIGYRVQYAPANHLGVWVIDIDHCRNTDTGEISGAALDIIQAINSYTEISPSGTGVHIWLLAPRPDDVSMFEREYKANSDSQEIHIEIYGDNKIMRLSGNQYGHYGNAPTGEPQAVEATEQLQSLLNKYCRRPLSEMAYQQPQEKTAPVAIEGLKPLPTIEDFLRYVDNVKAKRVGKIARGEAAEPNKLVAIFEPVPVQTLDGLRAYCAETLGQDDLSRTVWTAVNVIYHNLCFMGCIVNQTSDSTAALTDFLYRLLALCPRSIYNQCNYRESKYSPGKETAVWTHDITKALAGKTPEYKTQGTAGGFAAPSVEDVAAMIESMTKETLSDTLQETARDYIALEKAGRTDEAKALMDKAISVKRKDAFDKAIKKERMAERATEKEEAAALAAIQKEEARQQRITAFYAADRPQWVHTKETQQGIFPKATMENIEAYLRYQSLEIRYNELSDEPQIFEIAPTGNYLPALEERCREKSNLNGLTARIVSDSKVYDMPDMSASKAALFLKGIALKNGYNPFRDFLTIAANHYNAKGKPTGNIEKYFTDMLTLADGAESDREYYLYLFKYWMVQAVRLAANNKAHQINPAGFLVLQSLEQNTGKSSFVRLLIPEEYHLTKDLVSLDVTDRDSKREAITAAVVEIPEFGSTNKKKFRDELKAFFTSPTDRYRNPFDIFPTGKPRQTSFIGTINNVEFLKDNTGSRRYWVIPTMRGGTVPLEERVKTIDRLSMWGEAIELSKDFETFPIGHLPLTRLTQLETINEQFQSPTAIETAILDTYDFSKPPADTPKRSKEIAVDIGFRPDDCRKVGQLLTTWAKQGKIESRYSHKSYEYFLPPKRSTSETGFIY